MMVSRKLLRWLMPRSEGERMVLREWLNRANAEAEDLTRTIIRDADKLHEAAKKIGKANGECK